MQLFKRKKKENNTVYSGSLDSFPLLKALKPREKYVFHSDYFTVDGGYATIMSFFHQPGATDGFAPFWGVNKIPSGLGNRVTVFVFEQTRRMGEGWLLEHQGKAESVANMSANEHARGGSNTTKGRAARKSADLATIAQELQNGASYLHTHWRIMVKAPTLEELDDAVKKIDRLYIDRFATLGVAPYHGEQRKELSSLFWSVKKKLGQGYYFTSTEYAGSYNLVTHGLEDPTGEYVGYMVGDVNNSAVLFDVNKYKHHIVVADENFDEKLDRAYQSDKWGSKISQSCLIENGKVVHIVMDNCDMSKLGPAMDSITYKVDMSHGDVNMFEMFGDTDDELSIFPSQMEKLVLMAEQAYESTEADRSIIRGELMNVAKKFYIDNRMWYDNAVKNRERIRILNIPHKEVPKLEMFVAYLNTEHKAAINAGAKDSEAVHALKVLSMTFQNLLASNGDLFNTTTNDVIDGAKTGNRVIYDFRGLTVRGKGVAMAQLVNIISFAVGNLGEGDTVVFHGSEIIDDSIKPYINAQLEHLYTKGGRVCFLYNNIDKMLKDRDFCHFDKADYTILGNMTETAVAEYQKLLGQEIPRDLSRLIATKSDSVCYIHRGVDNVVFKQELSLGINEKGGNS